MAYIIIEITSLISVCAVVICWKIIMLFQTSPIQMWIAARLLKHLNGALFPYSKIII